MLSRTIKRAVGVGVAVLAASAAVGLGAGAAHAAEVGTLSISPASGNNLTPITVGMSGPCPGGTNLVVKLYGSGFPAAGFNVVANSGQSTYPTNPAGGRQVPLSNHFQAFADAQSPPATLSGEYRLELTCRNSLAPGGPTNTGFGEFNGRLNFSSPTTYSEVVPPSTNGTATTVTAAPASPQVVGTSVTFTANITADDGTLEAGSVQFMDGAAALGAAQPVAAGATGTASVTTAALAAGSHSITAVFTSTAGPQTGSTSPAITYVISAAAQATTTALSVPSNVTAGTPTPITATVSAASGTPVGSVEFFDGAASIGSAPVNGSGVASISPSFVVGPHSLTATFTPTNPANFTGSTSPAVTFTATAPAYDPDPQTIRGEIPVGTLIIDTPYTPANPLNLGVLALNPGGTMFSASAPFADINISDTRAGNLPWTASAFAGTLTNGGTGQINGQNVGLTALVPTYTPGNGLSPANPVTVTNHPAASPAVAPADPGTLGLGNAPHAFAHANNGAGSVELNGSLTLNAPSSTQAGVYTGLVTFTIAGS